MRRERQLREHTWKGTSFYVYLPRVTAAAGEADTALGPVAGGAERILFVDDEEDIVKLETRLLRDLGDGLVSRTSSLAALHLFSADPHAFDLVISDFTMPKMTGGELIGKVRELRPAIPAILISGFHDATVYAERSAEVPPMECVKKPFSRAELAQAIRRALDRRAAVARELDVS